MCSSCSQGGVQQASVKTLVLKSDNKRKRKSCSCLDEAGENRERTESLDMQKYSCLDEAGDKRERTESLDMQKYSCLDGVSDEEKIACRSDQHLEATHVASI